MSFGDVLRSAASPSSAPKGIGGNANTIWHCDDSANRIYELRTGDFSVIRYAASPTTYVRDIGGDDTTIWYSDDADDIYELSTIDLSVIRSAASPSTAPYGIGGDANTIWHSDAWINRTYELHTTDFSVIRYASSPTINPLGIGGDANTIWHCDLYEYTYELSTTDFSVIQSRNIINIVRAVGGDSNTIWDTSGITDRIYELDVGAPSTYTISGNVKDGDGNNLEDVTITLEDGTDYETDTDVNGDYTQDVDPDIYTVTASLSGYISDSAVVDASAGDQTQNFTLIRPVISGNVKDGDGVNLEDVIITLENGTDYSTSTDASGNYTQDVDPDIYALTASLAGYISDSAVVDVSIGDQTQNFTLIRPVISGNVKDGDGVNLEDVIITLENGTDYSTSTDASGNYTQDVDPDIYALTASLAGYISDSAVVDVSIGDQTQNFTLIRPVISGNIKDNVGYNVNGVNIIFTDDTSYSTITDSDGNYSQDVDPDVYNVEASLTGYIPDSESVDATILDQTQDFVLSRDTAPHDKGIKLGSKFLLNG